MLIQQKDTINFRFLPRTKASFTGGKVSSDSGLLLYKEFIEKMGINDIIADHLCFDDKNENRVHLMEDVLTQILYQKLAGYHSDLAATQLRNDPVFNTIQNNRALASQPTLSRFHTELTEEHLSNLRKINELILENAYKVENPTEMIYDLDSTFIKVYGNQEDSSYSGFYGDIGYHPLVLFDGITGDFLKCTLDLAMFIQKQELLNLPSLY